jgi:hypothetical protein
MGSLVKSGGPWPNFIFRAATGLPARCFFFSEQNHLSALRIFIYIFLITILQKYTIHIFLQNRDKKYI